MTTNTFTLAAVERAAIEHEALPADDLPRFRSALAAIVDREVRTGRWERLSGGRYTLSPLGARVQRFRAVKAALAIN